MEASRILSVLEDAVSQLKILSVVTPEVMDRLEVLEDVIDRSTLLPLYELRGAVDDHENGEGSVIESSSYAKKVIMALGSDDASHAALNKLNCTPSVAYMELISELERLVSFTQKQLSTTVEEEKGQEAHFKEVIAREERANNERMSLEQQLRAERRERSKAMASAEAMEKRTRTELSEIQSSIGMTRDRVEQEANATSTADSEWFEKQQASLLRNVEKLEKELSELQVENRSKETKLRKKKANVVDQVHTAIQEYDRELGEKEAAYRTELGEYKEVQRSLAEYESKMDSIRGQIEKLDAMKAAAKEAKDIAEKKAFQERDEAAAYIQKIWKKKRETVIANSKKAKPPKKAKT